MKMEMGRRREEREARVAPVGSRPGLMTEESKERPPHPVCTGRRKKVKRLFLGGARGEKKRKGRYGPYRDRGNAPESRAAFP